MGHLMKLVFSSFPDLADNVIPIIATCLGTNNKGKYYYLYTNDANLNDLQIKAQLYLGVHATQVHFVRKNSLLGIFHYLTAKYIFETHGIFEKFPKLPWQTKVNLWHGMPLKKIGYVSDKNTNLKMDYTISTSPIFDDIIARVFNISQNKIIKIGEPRNDLFYHGPQFLFTNIFNNDWPTIIWLPTYRQSEKGSIHNDAQQKDTIGGLNINDLLKLQDIFANHGFNLAIKLHPMDILNNKVFNFPTPNIHIINNQEFTSYHIEVNTFLKASTALITDYSSVYFDYVLLQKPIGILAWDQAEYQQKRGFVSKAVKENMLGHQINQLSDFNKFLTAVAQAELGYDAPKTINFFDKYDTHGSNSINLLKQIGLG